jgi:hypothetical protein
MQLQGIYANYFTKYLIKTISISVFLVLSGFIILKITNHSESFVHLVFLVGLFLITNIIAHYFLINSTKSRPIKFFRIFIIITVIKILVYISVLIIYILSLKFGIKTFLVCFLMTYLAFTAFEVIELSKFLKNSNTK